MICWNYKGKTPAFYPAPAKAGHTVLYSVDVYKRQTLTRPRGALPQDAGIIKQNDSALHYFDDDLARARAIEFQKIDPL